MWSVNIFSLRQENPAEEDAVVVEKILGSRMRTKDTDVSNKQDKILASDSATTVS